MAQACDVLYVHSIKNPNDPEGSRFGYMPMGIIGILNGLCAKGVRVLGMNWMVEQILDPNFDLYTALTEIDYKILMTDLHWYEHSYGSMCVVEASKKAHPEVPTVIGGYTSTIFADEIMEKFPNVDYLVSGDSDLPVDQLVHSILGKNGLTVDQIPNVYYRFNGTVCPPENTWVQTTLDDIDFAHMDFFVHQESIPQIAVNGLYPNRTDRWLCIARGCKFNCSYCCGANKNMQTLFRRCNILLRSAQKVAEDFCCITEQGIHQVSPSHDFQMFGKDYYHEIFSRIRERNVKPGMYLECFQLPTKDYIDAIAETFNKDRLIIALSPISGNDQLRRENGKLFSNAQFYDILGYMRQKGVRFILYYTLNPVGETKQQFEDTLFQMQYLKGVYGLGRGAIIYQRVVVDPLAGLRDIEGTNAQYNTFMDYYNYCQVPYKDRNSVTGYSDLAELDPEYKMAAYDALFPVTK